jgi:hypothetical protein
VLSLAVNPRSPSNAQLRQRQVSRKLAAAVPNHSPIGGCALRQSDRVAGHLDRILRAEPQTHEHAGFVEARE